MQRDSKLGYGFLLVGAGLPYLIDKALGLPAAIIVSVACVVFGGAFLLAGARHKEEEERPRKKIWEGLIIVAALGTLVYLGSVGIFRIMPKKESAKSEENPTTARDSRPSNEPGEKKEPPKIENPPATKKKTESLKDSLVINALAGYGNYVEGSTIGSVNPIKWKNYYSEVQVIFVNTSSEDYDAFDVSVDPDQVIFAVSQITEIPGVSIFSRNGGPGSQLLPPEETKPLPPNSVLLLPNNIDSSPRRVRCEKFPASIPMRLIFAVANVKFPPGTKHGHTLMFGFGTPDLNPKVLPQWVKIEGSYKLQGQKFHVSKTVEFTQAALP
jgi:hypothetical protein